MTDSLRIALEEVSGRDLQAFFQTWLYNSGHPEVQTWWSFDARENRVELTVEQTQRDADNAKMAFDIELDVEIATGTKTRIERVHVDRRRAQFHFDPDASQHTQKILQPVATRAHGKISRASESSDA